MAYIKKTKVGSEYRVRDKKGKIHGEYNSPKKAAERAAKLTRKKKMKK